MKKYDRVKVTHRKSGMNWKDPMTKAIGDVGGVKKVKGGWALLYFTPYHPGNGFYYPIECLQKVS